MQPTVVFDLDKVLLGGDASTLFLSGRLRQAPRRALPLLLAAPLLMPGAAVSRTRPLAARLMTRIAVGGSSQSDVDAVADAYGRALARKPEAAVAEAIACVRRHQADGDQVVVATGVRGDAGAWLPARDRAGRSGRRRLHRGALAAARAVGDG